MKISTRGRYALRTMVDLAQHSDEGLVTLKDVAARQELSQKYLEQIVTQLSKAGLIKGVRGPQGGYRLNREPKDYSVAEILEEVKTADAAHKVELLKQIEKINKMLEED